MEEIWCDIPGYEGIYEASTHGRIRTKEGKATWSSRFNCPRVWEQRILKPKICTNKYGRQDARVELYKNNSHKTHLVSRLVAYTFLSEAHDGLTVNHIDGNPLNNHVENLELVPLADNIRHGVENGLYTHLKKIVLVSKDGARLEFRSMCDASKFLGRRDGYISNALKKGNRIRDGEGNYYTVE